MERLRNDEVDFAYLSFFSKPFLALSRTAEDEVGLYFPMSVLILSNSNTPIPL